MGTSGSLCSFVPSLLLLVDGSHRQRVCEVLLGIEPGCRIQIAASPAAASLLLASGTVHLVILDLRLSSVQPLSLIHHLARISPKTAVLAFDETAAQSSTQPHEVWAWSELATVLARTLKEIADTDSGDTTFSPSQGTRP